MILEIGLRMKSFPRTATVAAALLLALVPFAAAQAIPAIAEIPDGISRPDLVAERASLESERGSLRSRVLAQKAECGSVEENTGAWQTCVQLRAQLQSEMQAHIARTNAFNAKLSQAQIAEPVKLDTPSERKYTFAGNGLIAGTTWTVFASRKLDEPEQRMCDIIRQQSKLAGAPYEGVDCKRYQFVLGMAVSVDAFTDLKNRVALDNLSNGQFSAHSQALYDKLRGKAFAELGCHSNGAMICLAALENRDVKADHVVLYGPQVTRESLALWNQLVQDGRVKSVKVYINENDVVPGASIAYADFKKLHAADEAALFKIDTLKRTINETSPRLLVQTFPCSRDKSSLECHAMSMYEAKVNCTGKSSGRPVPGTALPGGHDLPEPPLPCEAIGRNP
jgi:hypothetical protein